MKSAGANIESHLVCAGCGQPHPPDDPAPYRCQRARRGDDVDHVVVRSLDLAAVSFPFGGDVHPFVRFRGLLHAWRSVRRREVPDSAWCAEARRLEIGPTPFRPAPELASALGGEGLWTKDETGNIAGSHKFRHLYPLALHLLLTRARNPRLAIASCGNAALAAAEIARAFEWELETFVSADASSETLALLAARGAHLVPCSRSDGDPPGDPCWRRFLAAVAKGAVPFTVQGPANGLVIEGGATLVWELIAADGPSPPAPIDDLFVQVGGGALLSACHLGLRDALALGAIERMPRIFAVQTEGGHPLERAWRALATELAEELANGDGAPASSDAELAALLFDRRESELVQGGIERAGRHRSRYVQPWVPAPRSVATGILDDEPHDWLACVRAMIETGGWPVVVSDEEILEARDRTEEHTGVPVSATGAAGLAGWARLSRQGALPSGRRAVALLTGVRR